MMRRPAAVCLCLILAQCSSSDDASLVQTALARVPVDTAGDAVVSNFWHAAQEKAKETMRKTGSKKTDEESANVMGKGQPDGQAQDASSEHTESLTIKEKKEVDAELAVSPLGASKPSENGGVPAPPIGASMPAASEPANVAELEASPPGASVPPDVLVPPPPALVPEASPPGASKPTESVPVAAVPLPETPPYGAIKPPVGAVPEDEDWLEVAPYGATKARVGTVPEDEDWLEVAPYGASKAPVAPVPPEEPTLEVAPYGASKAPVGRVPPEEESHYMLPYGATKPTEASPSSAVAQLSPPGATKPAEDLSIEGAGVAQLSPPGATKPGALALPEYMTYEEARAELAGDSLLGTAEGRRPGGKYGRKHGNADGALVSGGSKEIDEVAMTKRFSMEHESAQTSRMARMMSARVTSKAAAEIQAARNKANQIAENDAASEWAAIDKLQAEEVEREQAEAGAKLKEKAESMQKDLDRQDPYLAAMGKRD